MSDSMKGLIYKNNSRGFIDKNVLIHNRLIMATSENRRVTDPLVVQQFWAAIQYIRMQKQMANSERIARYMEREHEMTFEEAEKQLEVGETLLMKILFPYVLKIWYVKL